MSRRRKKKGSKYREIGNQPLIATQQSPLLPVPVPVPEPVPTTVENDKLLQFEAAGYRHFMRQNADGTYTLTQKIKLTKLGEVNPNKRRFRLCPLTIEMARQKTKPRTYAIRSLLPKGVDKHGEPVYRIYKFSQGNIVGRPRDPEKEKIIMVDRETAVNLETMTTIFEEVYE